MDYSFLISFFLVMFPLVISPGPSNIVFAASGIKYGVKQSLPLMFGVDLTLVLKSLLIGFGLSTFLKDNPSVLSILQIVGAFYLFYLAYTFFKATKKNTKENERKLGFVDGIIIQFFNVKGWVLVSLMFSLFSNNGFIENSFLMVLLLVVMLCVLNVIAHLIWISFSSYIMKLFFKTSYVQNIIFSFSLFFVALWFLFENQLLRELFI